MQITNNALDQQGTNSQQLRFVPISSNVSYLGTTVSYGIGMNTQLSALNSGTTVSGNWDVTQQLPYTNSQVVGATPYISASQFGQSGSGMFNGTAYNKQITGSTRIQPTIDISETSSDIVVSAYVSNSAVNDLNLNVTEDSLTISGTLLSGNNHFVMNRTVALTTSVRAEAVEATLQSGVLEIRLPKTERFSRTTTAIKKDVSNVILNK